METYYIDDKYCGPPLSPRIYRVIMDMNHHYRAWVLDRNEKSDKGFDWREIDLNNSKERDTFFNHVLTCAEGGYNTAKARRSKGED